MMGGKGGSRSSMFNESSKGNRRTIKSTETDNSQSCSNTGSHTNTLSDSHTEKRYTSINDDDDLMCLNDIPGYDVKCNDHLPKDISRLNLKAHFNESPNTINTEINVSPSCAIYKTRSSVGQQSKRSNTFTDNKVGQFEVQLSGSGGLKPLTNLECAIMTENKDFSVRKDAQISIGYKRKSINQIEVPYEQNSAPLSGFINNYSGNRNEDDKKKFIGNITAEFSNWDGIESAIDAMGQEEKLSSRTTVESSCSSSNSILKSRNITWLKSCNELDENGEMIELEPVKKKIKLEPVEEFQIKSEPKCEIAVQFQPIEYEVSKSDPSEVMVKSEPISHDEYSDGNRSCNQNDEIPAKITIEQLKATLANIARCDMNSAIESMCKDEQLIVKSKPKDDGNLNIVHSCNFDTSRLPISNTPEIDIIDSAMVAMHEDELNVKSEKEPSNAFNRSGKSAEVINDDIYIVYDSTHEERTNSIIMDQRSSCLKLTKDKLPSTLTQEVNNVQDGFHSKPTLKEIINRKQKINNSESSSHSKPILKESFLNLKESANSYDNSQMQNRDIECLLNYLTSRIDLHISSESALKKQYELEATPDENYAIGTAANKKINLNEHNVKLSTESVAARLKSASQLAKQSSLIQGRRASQPDNLTNSWIVEHATDKFQQDISNAQVTVCDVGASNTKDCLSVQLREPNKLNLKSSKEVDGASSINQSSQRIIDNDIAMPLNFRNMLHLLQQMGDDSTDSERSSLRLEESVKNIIQRLSSPKTDSNNASDVELDGSGNAAENSRSLNFTEPSQFGLNPRSTLPLCPQNSPSVISECQNIQCCDASDGSISENYLAVPSTSQSELGAATKVLRDDGVDQPDTSGDPANLTSVNAELKRLLSRGMLLDNMSGTVTLSINHFIKYFLKVYAEKTKAATALRECRQEIILHNQHVEETQKRIDQLRAAMRVHIMQQEAYYRSCGWSRKIDTRTVGVNVRILEESYKELKVRNDETAFLQYKKLSEKIPSPFATDDASIITASGGGSKTKRNNAEAAHKGEHQRATISIPQKIVNSRNSVPALLNIVCHNVTRQKISVSNDSTQKLVDGVSQTQRPIINNESLHKVLGDGPQKAVDSSDAPQKIVIVNSQKTIIDNGDPTQKTMDDNFPQKPANDCKITQNFIDGGNPFQLSVDDHSYPPKTVKGCNSQKIVCLSSQAISTEGLQKTICTDDFQTAVHSDDSQRLVHNGGSLGTIDSGYPQNANISNILEKTVSIGNPEIMISKSSPLQAGVENNSQKLVTKSNSLKILRKGNQPQISIRSYGSPRKAGHIGCLRKKVFCTGGLLKKFPPNVIWKKNIHSRGSQGKTTCINDSPQVAIRSGGPPQVAIRSNGPPQVAIRSNGPLQAAIRGSTPHQVAIRSGGPPPVAVRSNSPLQVAIRSGGPPQVAIRSSGPPQFAVSSNGSPQVKMSNNLADQSAVHSNPPPDEKTLSKCPPEKNISCHNDPPQKSTCSLSPTQNRTCNFIPPQNILNGNDSSKKTDNGDPVQITESSDNAQNVISKIDPQDAIDASQTSDTVNNNDLQNASSSDGAQNASNISDHSPTVNDSSSPPVSTCNIGSQIAVDCTDSLQVAVDCTDSLQVAVDCTDSLQVAIDCTDSLQVTVDCTDSLQVVVDSSATPQIEVDNKPLQIATGRNTPKKNFPICNSSQVPVYGSGAPPVAIYCKDSPVVTFDDGDPSRVTFDSNAPSHIVLPGNNPQDLSQISRCSSNPPQSVFSSSNPPQGMFSNNNSPQVAHDSNYSTEVTFATHNLPGAISPNDSFPVAFDKSKSAKAVATSTVSLQGMVRDSDLTQRFICSNNLIGSPQVLMPVDSKVRQDILRTLHPSPAAQNHVEVVVISSDDDDPPPAMKEKKILAKKPRKALAASSSNVPPIPILPSLPSMLRIIPSTPSINATIPDGNMQIVRPSNPTLTTRVAYLLPQTNSAIFPQINSPRSVFRTPTPGGLQNMVIFTPIISPTQSGGQRAISTRPIAAIKQIMMSQRAERPTVIQTFPQIVANLGSPNSQLTLTPRFTKHPAPLPLPPNYPMNLGLKSIPPRPSLKVSRTSAGIVLSWNMSVHNGYAEIYCYQLYAYQEEDGHVDSSLWKKVNEIKAMPLPMACTLSRFPDGHKYHFTVRAVDIHRRVGLFSDSVSVQLSSTKATPPKQS